MAERHRCGPWIPVDTRASDPNHMPGPDTVWICQECRLPLSMSEGRTPCPRCGDLLPFDEVLAHGKCGYTMPSTHDPGR